MRLTLHCVNPFCDIYSKLGSYTSPYTSLLYHNFVRISAHGIRSRNSVFLFRYYTMISNQSWYLWPFGLFLSRISTLYHDFKPKSWYSWPFGLFLSRISTLYHTPARFQYGIMSKFMLSFCSFLYRLVDLSDRQAKTNGENH